MNSKKARAKFLFLLYLFWILHACTIKRNPSTTIVPGLFEIQGTWHVHAEQDKNGTKGYCFRGHDTLFFHQSRPTERQFVCPLNDYLLAFKNYHHATFFKYIFFDQKLTGAYRDSIKVDSVFPYEGQKELVYPCRGCNTVAKIRFRQSSYLVPHRLEPALLTRLESYHFTSRDRPKGHLCLFYPKDLGSTITGCEYIPASMKYVFQLYFHSSLPVEDKINLLSEIVFYE